MHAVGVQAPRPGVVGRDRELAELETTLADRARGELFAVEVLGPPGIGKTTLLRAFAQRTEQAQTAWVLHGRCSERASVPFKGFDTIIGALASRLESQASVRLELGTEAAALLRAFEVLRRLPAFAAVSSMVDEGWQDGLARVSVAVRLLLAEVGRQQPLVVLLDDLQWADHDVRSTVHALLDPPPGVMLVVASPERVALDARAVVRTISLEPLSTQASVALVEQELGEQAHAIDSHGIARASRGDPLVATMLARYSATTGERTSKFQDAVRQVTLRSGSLAVKIAELVCVAHAPLAVSVISRTLGTTGPALFEAVEALRAGHVLSTSGVASSMLLEPYHDRLRDVLTASLTTDARRKLHHAIATTLEASPSADPASLAQHWRDAGEPARAARHAVRAAERAELALAFHRAADMYRIAGELGENPLRARMKHAECLGLAGRGVESADAYLACAGSAEGVAAINLRRLAMQQLLLVGNIDRSLELLNQLMRELDLPNPTKPRRIILGFLLRRLRQLLRKARVEARSRDEIVPINGARIDVVWDAAAGLTLIDPLRAYYFQSLNMDLAQRYGDDVRVARALSGEVPLLAASGQVSKRLEHVFTLCDEVSRRMKVAAFPPMVRGYAGFFLGRWQQAVTDLSLAEALLVKERPIHLKEMYAPNQLFGLARRFSVACLYYLGRLRELERVLPILLRDAVERNDIAAATYFRAGVQCLGWLALGDVDTARRNVDDARGPWQTSRGRVPHFMDLNARTAIDIYEGRGAAAWERVTATWADFKASRLTRAQYPRVSLLDIRGRNALAAAVGAPAGERSMLLADANRCAARLRAEDAVWSVPLGDSIAAGAALLAGDPVIAQRHLDSAAAGFAAADMALYAANARFVRAQLAGDRDAEDTERGVLTAAGVANLDRYSRVLLPR